MPRVLLLITGGTILMRGKPVLEPDKAAARDLLAEVPALGRIARIDTRVLFLMDSGDFQPENWVAIARAVHEALRSNKYAGIVVVHGTDTMAYTASALALLLGPIDRPVILTGSQRPLAELRTDARENLINATLAATLPVPEVAIAFASRVLRGARSIKRDAWALEAFDSPNCPPLATMGVGVDVLGHVRKKGRTAATFDPRIESRVLAVRVFPGLDPGLLQGALRAGVRGLVLEAYGTGNLPHRGASLIPALEEARARKAPVVVVSQCPRGAVDIARYAGGAQASDAGAISGGDMTVECALAKLMIGLGRFGAGERLQRYLATDTVGEITSPGKPARASARKT
ncbi:asparaginase [Pendulispora brunnea]|uniref:asparaginase n=1 Tax=Pendulispora brunnea TaxID=2905690 RepID=A0ABZ2KNQ3_9BACT